MTYDYKYDMGVPFMGDTQNAWFILVNFMEKSQSEMDNFEGTPILGNPYEFLIHS